LWVIFALLDPDPDPDSEYDPDPLARLNTDPIRIRIHNPDFDGILKVDDENRRIRIRIH
jgi:hypothetical protein